MRDWTQIRCSVHRFISQAKSQNLLKLKNPEAYIKDYYIKLSEKQSILIQ